LTITRQGRARGRSGCIRCMQAEAAVGSCRQQHLASWRLCTSCSVPILVLLQVDSRCSDLGGYLGCSCSKLALHAVLVHWAWGGHRRPFLTLSLSRCRAAHWYSVSLTVGLIRPGLHMQQLQYVVTSSVVLLHVVIATRALMSFAESEAPLAARHRLLRASSHQRRYMDGSGACMGVLQARLYAVQSTLVWRLWLVSSQILWWISLCSVSLTQVLGFGGRRKQHASRHDCGRTGWSMNSAA
jgi:hypothetical protein